MNHDDGGKLEYQLNWREDFVTDTKKKLEAITIWPKDSGLKRSMR